jgi:hypothetical protein
MTDQQRPRPALRRANARNRGVLKNIPRSPVALIPQTAPTPAHTAGHGAPWPPLRHHSGQPSFRGDTREGLALRLPSGFEMPLRWSVGDNAQDARKNCLQNFSARTARSAADARGKKNCATGYQDCRRHCCRASGTVGQRVDRPVA